MINLQFILTLSFFYCLWNCECLLFNNKLISTQPQSKKNYNPFIKKNYKKKLTQNNTEINIQTIIYKKYTTVRPDFIELIKHLNLKNNTLNNFKKDEELKQKKQRLHSQMMLNNAKFLKSLGVSIEFENTNEEIPIFYESKELRNINESPTTKSKNFQVTKNKEILFKDVGGYDNIKEELRQCVDILKNYNKYKKYNVRIPKGLIFEGPPGTGKTLLAKALAGESNCSFIPVSGSDFQEIYVGVGSSRIKELFELGKQNAPCIIFVDEIDALGRKRSTDGESSSNERDNTLNALLVELDGFKNNTGVFLVAATNRIDLLDGALIRPGRIDKKIFIGFPDKKTREAIIKIHINGKPNEKTVQISDLVELTEGFSGAQIENLLNEAMLNALKLNKTKFNNDDFELVLNKMMVGWQPNDHELTDDIINRIAVHEMGHAIVGLFSKHHSKVSKVVINLSSPKSPGYTVFEASTANIHKREALFERLMILLAGRIAEEVFYDISVTTGAINDFEEALKLAEKMIIHYGMGSNLIYPSLSEKYKELIDNEVIGLINDAYKSSEKIIKKSKELISETSKMLVVKKILKVEMLNNLIEKKYKHLKI